MHQLSRLTLMLLPGVSACFTEIPVGLTVPAPESHVIARLTDVGSVTLAPLIGPGATLIEGIVATATDSTWQLHMVRVDYLGGSSSPWNRELVTFPRSALTGVTQKTLNKKKSWVVGGAAMVGALLLERLLNGAFANSGDPKGPTEPPIS
jgi:hypothetical protein